MIVHCKATSKEVVLVEDQTMGIVDRMVVLVAVIRKIGQVDHDITYKIGQVTPRIAVVEGQVEDVATSSRHHLGT